MGRSLDRAKRRQVPPTRLKALAVVAARIAFETEIADTTVKGATFAEKHAEMVGHTLEALRKSGDQHPFARVRDASRYEAVAKDRVRDSHRSRVDLEPPQEVCLGTLIWITGRSGWLSSVCPQHVGRKSVGAAAQNLDFEHIVQIMRNSDERAEAARQVLMPGRICCGLGWLRAGYGGPDEHRLLIVVVDAIAAFLCSWGLTFTWCNPGRSPEFDRQGADYGDV
jgi:hypothetical protein